MKEEKLQQFKSLGNWWTSTEFTKILFKYYPPSTCSPEARRMIVAGMWTLQCLKLVAYTYSVTSFAGG